MPDTPLLPVWTALALIVAANGVTGALLWRRLRGRAGTDGPAQLLAVLGLGTVVNGWLALVAAELALFTPAVVGGAWLVVAVAAGVSGGGFGRIPAAWPRPAWRRPSPTAVVWLLWLPLALWLYLRPHEFIKGGADAGVYVNLAASIARLGRIPFSDPTLADLDPALAPALLRPLPPGSYAPAYVLPGFYVVDGSTVVPQFYALHPVWQAVAHALGGVHANLALTGVWALLGSVAVAATAQALSDRRGAALALAAMTLLGPQIWFARYPTTEMLTQFLLWTGVWSVVNWLRRPGDGVGWPLLAGAALGSTLLARIDMFFLLALPPALWVWRRLARRLPPGAAPWASDVPSRRELTVFTLALAVPAAQSFAHGALLSSPYFFDTYGYALTVAGQVWWVAAAAAAGAAGVWWGFGRIRPTTLTRLSAAAGQRRRTLAAVAVAALVALALYAWFIRPQAPTVTRPDWFGGGTLLRLDDENFVRLGWYLAPLGVWLGVAGAALMVWRLDRRLALPLAVGLLFTLLYVWRLQSNPKHIYAMRRYVPAVFPFFVIAGSLALHALLPTARGAMRGAQRATALAALAALAWLVGIGWSARGFVGQVDDAGLVAQVAAVAAELDPDSVLLFDETATIGQGDTLGTPLQFLHGHSVFVLRNQAALDRDALARQVDRWLAAGRAVYWIAPPDGSGWPGGRALLPVTGYEIVTRVLEESAESKPVTVETRVWRGVVARVSAE